MFNYSARQIIVLHPAGTGGGLLSFLLSLDSRASSLDFKNKSVDEKIKDWNCFTQTKASTAHLYGFINWGHLLHKQNIENANHSDTYVHKCHFYELQGNEIDNNRHPLLNEIVGEKISIGIYLTDECADQLVKIRPNTPPIDFYQKWVYSNQVNLMRDFFGINTVHHFPYSDMLVQDKLIEHIDYCKSLLSLDLDLDRARIIIDQWRTRVLKVDKI